MEGFFVNPRVKSLADKIASIRTTMQSMTDTAEREDRDFTPEENETFGALKAEHISLENRKARIEELLVDHDTYHYWLCSCPKS